MPVNTTVQVRRGTAARWASTNPVLADGEFGWDETNKTLKVGDGSTAWASLNASVDLTLAAKAGRSLYLASNYR